MSNMCKTRTNTMIRILVAVLLLGLLVIGVTAASAETGDLTIQLKENHSQLHKDQVELTIYQIGIPDGSSPTAWTIFNNFSHIKIMEAKPPARSRWQRLR